MRSTKNGILEDGKENNKENNKENSKALTPEVYARKWRFYDGIFRFLLRLILGYRCEKVPKQDGPVFYLYNHTTDIDFTMLVAAAENPAYFVVTDSFVRGGKLAERLSERYSFILHDKGGSGIATAREILERIRDGYSVAMAPEGNRSFDGVTCPIPDSVAKLVRKSGATLVTFRFTGGYFTSPRWSRGFRRGRIMGKPMGIYTPEGLKEMKPKELADRIREDLWVDAMMDEKKRPIPYRSRHRAEYLESLLYLCPKCRTFDSLYSGGSRIRCECGYSMEYSEYGYLVDERGRRCSIAVLAAGQKRELGRLLRAEKKGSDTALFLNQLTEHIVDPEGKIVGRREVVLSASVDGLTAGDRTYRWDEVSDVSIVQRNLLILHIRDQKEHLEYLGSKRFNAMKYRDAFLCSNRKNGFGRG